MEMYDMVTNSYGQLGINFPTATCYSPVKMQKISDIIQILQEKIIL